MLQSSGPCSVQRLQDLPGGISEPPLPHISATALPPAALGVGALSNGTMCAWVVGQRAEGGHSTAEPEGTAAQGLPSFLRFNKLIKEVHGSLALLKKALKVCPCGGPAVPPTLPRHGPWGHAKAPRPVSVTLVFFGPLHPPPPNPPNRHDDPVPCSRVPLGGHCRRHWGAPCSPGAAGPSAVAEGLRSALQTIAVWRLQSGGAPPRRRWGDRLV